MARDSLRFENGTEITEYGAFRPDNSFVAGVELARKLTQL